MQGGRGGEGKAKISKASLFLALPSFPAPLLVLILLLILLSCNKRATGDEANVSAKEPKPAR